MSVELLTRPILTVVPKSTLTEVREAIIDGVVRRAGIMNDLRSNQAIDKFLPHDISLSWVALENLNPLETHVHPVASQVAIIRGRAKLIGQESFDLEAGEVVHIPPGHWHGFAPVDEQGFLGLSWQPTRAPFFHSHGERMVYFKGESDLKTEQPVIRVNAEGIWRRFEGDPFEFKCVRLEPGENFEPLPERNLLLVLTEGSAVAAGDQRIPSESAVLIKAENYDSKITAGGQGANLALFAFTS